MESTPRKGNSEVEELRRRGGIRDWEQKKQVLIQVLPAYSNLDIFQKVLEGSMSGPGFAAEARRLAEASRHWGEHTPIKDGAFFDLLVGRLQCEPGTTGMSFFTASVAEFIKMLPEKDRKGARNAAGILDSHSFESQPLMPLKSVSPRVVYLHHTEQFHSMASGIEAGMLDTRHYYSTADAAATWQHLTSSPHYPMYDHCKWGLCALVESEDWKQSLEIAKPSTAIMLGGGGAPSKDMVIASSLLNCTCNDNIVVTMVLVDINPYMLLQSESYLRREIKKLPNHERIEVLYATADILKLGTTAQPVFPRCGAAVFAITGGTFGNISEAEFFRSLNRVAQPGDLLIISADTADDIPAEQLTDQWAQKYNHKDMHRLIRPGVIAVLSEMHIQESPDEALNRVKLDITPNSLKKLSDVANSWNVTLSFNAGARNITLVRSTRYQANSLINFVGQFGWEIICSIPSPLNPNFFQFAFRRKQS